MLVEVTHIYGRSDHWIDKIINEFAWLMHDLVEKIKVDLVLMEVWLDRCDKKGSNVVNIHHCAKIELQGCCRRVMLCFINSCCSDWVSCRVNSGRVPTEHFGASSVSKSRLKFLVRGIHQSLGSYWGGSRKYGSGIFLCSEEEERGVRDDIPSSE